MIGLLQQVALLSAAVLGLMVLVALWNLAAAPRLHRRRPVLRGPSVSVLIPARDEAANLRRLLPALLASRYAPLEVLVLDDGSADETAAVVRGFAAADPRLRLVVGGEAPDGWTGKNWACHQLARNATGAFLLFCDADVIPGPDAIGRTVAALADAGAVTAFPRHERGDWFERAVIPLVAQLPVAALLPLPLARRTRSRSLAVGNGQWFAWRRGAYGAAGGHRAVRREVLEDVALARRAKAAGVRLAPVLAPRDLSIRMYRTRRDVWDGFSKNLYPLVGGRPWTLGLASLLFVLTMGAPLLLPLVPGLGPSGLLPLALLLVLRSAAAAAFGDPPSTVALHPLGASVVALLALESWRRHRAGTVTWKRRTLAVRPLP